MAIDVENIMKLHLAHMMMRKQARHHRGGVQARLLTSQARAFFFFSLPILWFRVWILALLRSKNQMLSVSPKYIEFVEVDLYPTDSLKTFWP